MTFKYLNPHVVSMSSGPWPLWDDPSNSYSMLGKDLPVSATIGAGVIVFGFAERDAEPSRTWTFKRGIDRVFIDFSKDMRKICILSTPFTVGSDEWRDLVLEIPEIHLRTMRTSAKAPEQLAVLATCSILLDDPAFEIPIRESSPAKLDDDGSRE